MKISYVEMAGFRGFKDKTRFDFPSGFVVLTGRNGAGKSTVLDAIDFVLTATIDKFPKGAGLENHLWWVGDGVAPKQYVEIGFRDSTGKEFNITRTPSGLDRSPEEVAEALCIGQLADGWPRTLIQTTLIRDETLSSMSVDLPEQARFEAVRSAIGGLTGPDHSGRTSEIFRAAELAKEAQEGKLARVMDDLSRALTALTEARSATDRMPDVTEAEGTIKKLAPDLSTSQPNLSELLRARVADRKQSSQTIAQLISKAEQLAEQLAYWNSADGSLAIANAEAAVLSRDGAAKAAQNDWDAAKATSDSALEADRFATQMVALLNHGEEIGLIDGHCPLCDAVREDKDFREAIEQARNRLRERGAAASRAQQLMSATQARLLTEQQALQQARQNLTSLTERKSRTLQEVEDTRKQFERYGWGGFAENSSSLREAALKRQEETAALEHALFILESSSAYDRVAALEKRIKELRDSVDVETANLSRANRRLEAAREINNAAKTVANEVLTEQFDTVMPLLKELYQRLRPHVDWREIETDFGGKVRATLNFIVGNGKNPKFLFSSGQRRTLGMAFLLAIHISRPWSKLQSLLLDDPVQHIDDYRALNLVEVLSAIRRQGRQIIIAVEDAALADLLCRRLRATSNEGGIRYDVMVKANGSSDIETATPLSPLPSSVLDIAEAS
jgi:DNA repair exonuclease SbcCD ATPase subunit